MLDGSPPAGAELVRSSAATATRGTALSTRASAITGSERIPADARVICDISDSIFRRFAPLWRENKTFVS